MLYSVPETVRYYRECKDMLLLFQNKLTFYSFNTSHTGILSTINHIKKSDIQVVQLIYLILFILYKCLTYNVNQCNQWLEDCSHTLLTVTLWSSAISINDQYHSNDWSLITLWLHINVTDLFILVFDDQNASYFGSLQEKRTIANMHQIHAFNLY